MLNVYNRGGFLLLFACVIAFFITIQVATAATIYVKPTGNDANNGTSWALAKKTIQAAITAAAVQDLVLVADGTYGPITVDKAVITPALTIRSVNGPAVTIIDGGGSARCVELVSDVTLDGFTLTNGRATIGGGLLMTGGGLVQNCIISENSATGDGGGVYMNTPSGHAAMSIVKNCTIIGNTADGKGGGVYLVRGLGASSVENSTIRGNIASQGGGVEVTDRCYLRNCLIMGNTAATLYGGGVSVHSGGIVQNCTIVGNKAETAGGGVIIPINGTVVNCIIYYNENGDMYGPLENSCYGVGSQISGSGNITSAPLFVSTGSGYGASHVPGNYQLSSSSPCVNTGLNQDWMAGAKDLAGKTRIHDGQVDMGAYEWIGTGKTSQTITFNAIANQSIDSVVSLFAIASSGLPVTLTVVSGPAIINPYPMLRFSGTGSVSVRASQAGNATYDPAPSITHTFVVYNNTPISLRAVALTNNVILRWPNPLIHGFSNNTVHLRFSDSDYPPTPSSGSAIYTGTNRVYEHTGLTTNQAYYYTIFGSHDGSTWTNHPGF